MISIYIIPWIILGFLYLKTRKRFKIEFHKLSGQHYIFTLLFWGSIPLIISILSIFLIECIFGIETDFLNVLSNPNWITNLGTFSYIFLLSIFLTSLFSFYGNKLDLKEVNEKIENKKKLPNYKNSDKMTEHFKKMELGYLLFKMQNDPIKKAIFNNFFNNLNQNNINKQYLLFDLNNGKVYIGTVSQIGFPDDYHTPDSIEVNVRWSGYRNEKNGIILTTDYKEQNSITMFREKDIFSLKVFNEKIFVNLQKLYSHNTTT